MIFLGITGGVGSGKSEVLRILQKDYGAEVLYADDIAKQLMKPHTPVYRKLRKVFESYDVFCGDGTIDRPAMAQVLFSNDALRGQMNAIVHPAVLEYALERKAAMEREEQMTAVAEERKTAVAAEKPKNGADLASGVSDERIKSSDRRRETLLVLEAALLLEAGYDACCDEVWYVHAPEQVRRERLRASRGYSDERIDRTMKSQLPEEVFYSRCTAVIENGGSLEETRDQIAALMAGLKRR